MILKRGFLFILLILLSSTVLTGCNIKQVEVIIEEEEIIQLLVQDYYSQSYDAWIKLEMVDLSQYLDISSIQSYNKSIVLEENIEKWRYSIEQGYFKGERERHEISFQFHSIEIEGDEAEVKVTLSGVTTPMATYPFFVNFGENTFKLKKINNQWLIYDHDYTDTFFYEQSKTEKLILDLERVRKEVDNENK